MNALTITPLRAQVLRAIEARPGVSATEIARALEMPGGAIVVGKTAMELAWAGLVDRKPGERGCGASTYAITPAGSQAIKDAAMEALKSFATAGHQRPAIRSAILGALRNRGAA